MNEKWRMEEMGKLIKEEYLCSLSCIKRSKSADLGKNSYWGRSSLRPQPNRLNSRFHSCYRLFRRLATITPGCLVGDKVNPASSLERVSGISARTSIKYASQSQGCNCNYHYLDTGFSSLYDLGVAFCKWCKKHLKMYNETGGLVNQTVRCLKIEIFKDANIGNHNIGCSFRS